MAPLKPVLVLVSFFLVSCGVNQPVVLKQAPQTDVVKELTGEFETTDGDRIDLGELNEKPVVLSFIALGCSTCQKETAVFKEETGGGIPDSIQLLSVVVGREIPVANIVQRGWGIPWTVGADPTNELLESHCGIKQTPCTVVQVPGEGIQFRKTGEVSVAELKAITGAWE